MRRMGKDNDGGIRAPWVSVLVACLTILPALTCTSPSSWALVTVHYLCITAVTLKESKRVLFSLHLSEFWIYISK